MAEGALQRGRRLLRAVSAIAVTFGIVGCSPSMNENLDGKQSFAAQSAQLNAEQPLEAGPDGKKIAKTAGQDVAPIPPVAPQAAAASKAAPETKVAATEAATGDAETKSAEAKPDDPARPPVTQTAEAKPAEQDAPAGETKVATETPKKADAAETQEPAVATAATDPYPAPVTAPQQQRGLFGALFANNKANQPKKPGEQPVQVASAAPAKAAFAAPARQPAVSPRQEMLENPSPQLSFESLNTAQQARGARRNQAPEITAVRATAFADDGEGTGLPGVRKSALFDIKRKSGVDDDSDVDIHEYGDGATQVAFAPGMARLSPNGLLKQRDSVDVACLKPSLIRQIRMLEAKFGKKSVITSGYRSPNYNRSVRGAKNSQHMYCAAVDLQIPGVSKWELANFARSLPGRGGVGTYCHTDSVHVDIGPERDWNWRCRDRRG